MLRIPQNKTNGWLLLTFGSCLHPSFVLFEAWGSNVHHAMIPVSPYPRSTILMSKRGQSPRSCLVCLGSLFVCHVERWCEVTRYGSCKGCFNCVVFVFLGLSSSSLLLSSFLSNCGHFVVLLLLLLFFVVVVAFWWGVWVNIKAWYVAV